MRVVWDDDKNVADRKKHGISFEEASALFTQGDEYLEIFDEVHSDDEDRFIALVPSHAGLFSSFILSGITIPCGSSAHAGPRNANLRCIDPMLEAEHHDQDS